MHIHIKFNSTDPGGTLYSIPLNGHKKVKSVEIIGTSLESFQFSNIQLKVLFKYKNGQSVNRSVVFSQALSSKWIGKEAISVIPVKVMPDSLVQDPLSLSGQTEVTIFVLGRGDYNFTIEAEVEYVDLTDEAR